MAKVKGNPPMRLPADVQKMLRLIAVSKGLSVGDALRQMLMERPEYQEIKGCIEKQAA